MATIYGRVERAPYPRSPSADTLRELATRRVLAQAAHVRALRAGSASEVKFANEELGRITVRWEELTGSTWDWYGWRDLPAFADES